MTNPITNQVQNRHLTTETRRRGPEDSGGEQQQAKRTGEGESHADVDRAAQRLSQQTEQAPETSIDDLETAQQIVNRLHSSLKSNPQAAAAAFSGITQDGVEAAMARPTA